MFYEPSEISAAEKVTAFSQGCRNALRCEVTPEDEITLALSLNPPVRRGSKEWIDPRLAAIYVVGNQANSLCKIGYARDLRKRLLALQGSSPVQVQLCHFVYVVGSLLAKIIEADVHAMFDPERKHGEWFDVRPREAASAMSIAVAKRGYVWWDEHGRRDLGFKAGRLHSKDWARYSHRGRAHD